MSGDLREYECKHGIFERLCPKCSGGDNQAEMSNNAKLKYRIAELEKELKSYAHFGSEDDSLVSRLLGVYNSGGIERDFTKDGHFVPTINKEAAHRIKELEQQLAQEREANRWIPVTESIPKEQGVYLVSFHNGVFGWFDCCELYFTPNLVFNNLIEHGATHWRKIQEVK